MTRQISLGYVPLVDAAPLIIADDLGFAEEQGLRLVLKRAANWSMLRDMLDQGQVEAAQMLSVMPIARALGLGGGNVALETPLVLSHGGQIIGVSPEMAGQLAKLGHDFGFADAAAAAKAVTALDRPLRFGVPFAHSMQALLLDAWLGGGAELRTVAPPLMPEALAEGELDAFCVGEPWGSQAVITADARLLLPGIAIRGSLPEKVLALRSGWSAAEPDLAGRLIRALARAGQWLSRPANAATAAEIITRPGRVDVAAELVERALLGRIVTDRAGTTHVVPGFQCFGPADLMCPTAEQAHWIARRLAARFGLSAATAEPRAAAVFRADLYHRFLRPVGA